MAKGSARDTSYAERRRGQLWQVPMLLAGLLAVTGVWVVRPLWRDPARSQFADDLAALRHALDPQSADPARAVAIGESLQHQIDRFPQHAGQVHLLLGAAYLARAREASREQLVGLLTDAKKHLDRAAQFELSPADRERLTYRLARVRYLMGDAPGPVLDLLTHTPESASDDPFEYYDMLTQLHLRFVPPNLPAALDANAKQLALPTDGEDLLAPARLVRGEILVRLNQREEARKVLSRIRASSPAAVYARARLLRAQLCQEDKLWAEAMPLWEEILKDDQHPVPEPGRVKYYLGLCYRYLDRRSDAIRLWESALNEDAESKQAAGLRLAEIHLDGANPAGALVWFESALSNVKDAARYRNRLVELSEVRQLFERGARALIKAGEFARGRQLVDWCEPLFRDLSRQLLAEVAEAWAQDCEQRAGQSTGASADRLREQAAHNYRQAGEAYDFLAHHDPQQQSQWLQRGAQSYANGREFSRAADLLKRYLALETDPERLCVAWYKLAGLQRNLKDEPAARQAYLKCIEYPGPMAFRARYQLAAADIAAGRKENNPAKLEDAARALEHNLELMRFAPDDEAYEQTLLALADLLTERGNIRLAVIRLQEVLNRYPGSPRQLSVRYQLAQCYRRLAALEDQSLKANLPLPQEPLLHVSQQRRRWLQSAVANYQKIIDDLSARAAAGPLPASDESILRQALSAAAECHFDQGEFAEAISYYEELSVRCPHQVEALKALKQAVRCYWFLAGTGHEPQRRFFKEKARETIQRVRALLQQLPDTAFGDQPGFLSRQEEERWVEWAWKQ
jgi:tetratricopeptide (TPR) repeat protein